MRMSLSDLKKSKKAQTKKRDFTIDEFIEDADNYAKGVPQLVSAESDKVDNVAAAIDMAKAHRAKSDSAKPFRHATFTLSEESIVALNELAARSDLAKSHIIRILISELSTKDKEEQISRLLGSNIR